MKLHILSDLHLGVQGMEHPDTDADLVVLAGDIARPEQAVAWARGFAKPVLYVPGNHEFYGASLQQTPRTLQALCADGPVQLLDNRSLVLQGVRFIGSTLWSDFRIAGAGQARTDAMQEAQRLVRDFQRIRTTEQADAPLFSPQDAAALYDTNVQWLARMLAQPFDGPTVVITHHAPSPRSIHPRFAGSPLNAIFVSDAEALVAASGARLWIHGHTHDSFDYQVNATRVLCNPRGYAKEGVNENPLFDARLVVEIP
ncbi:metallophosphoesterase [Alicycliphilus denitrificans]|uniref:metallophosphoesterase n=1 Tax=Alicycliphilus denitrificans TaxID=179636 RepID=UPI00384D1450